ncbi:Uncharacterised protein [Psychrobacter phenylpyruvicus]|uniref:Uncharacterized protein n=1 Tax=Psychrobacter phenylpyruvicus TaxID=29432 RepID=A0A379LIY0_9GAMM|nr:Uncharacterised protein [Psychrobacter phenylpyruvicus]
MGSLLGQVLVRNSKEEKFIRTYLAKNFPKFLTGKSDKELFESMVKSLDSDMGLDEKELLNLIVKYHNMDMEKSATSVLYPYYL